MNYGEEIARLHPTKNHATLLVIRRMEAIMDDNGMRALHWRPEENRGYQSIGTTSSHFASSSHLSSRSLA